MRGIPPLIVTPLPASLKGPSPHARRGAFLFSLITLTIVATAFVTITLPSTIQSSETVLILRLDAEGIKQVGDLSLRTGAVTQRTGVDTSGLRIGETGVHSLSDGSVVAVEPAGIVRRHAQMDTMALLVASPVQATQRTPLAVWNDATRVAWVNPADQSLQIFEKNATGAYLPVYLNSDAYVGSMRFTDDGAKLVFASHGLDTTDFYVIDLPHGSVTSVATLDGVASILP